MPTPDRIRLDAVILGGGVAGLWTLGELTRAGLSVVLIEADSLGRGQTVGSQGILHGGLKYTLGGILTDSAKAIRDMPNVWRRCLDGAAPPDLSAVQRRSEFCHLWRTDSMRSRVGMIGARAGLRVAPVAIAPGDRPEVLASVPGDVLRLDEQVICPVSLITALAHPHTSQLLRVPPEQLAIHAAGPGRFTSLTLRDPASSRRIEIEPRVLVLAAGEGAAALRESLGLSANAMQRRPVHMIMARGDLPTLNGHCVDGAKTRVTITTARDSAGRTVWQIGGAVSETGVGMSESDLIRFAHEEVRASLGGRFPWNAQWATYLLNKAEAATRGGLRPDDAFVIREGDVITVWPTKLALAPRAAALVLEAINGTGPFLSVVDGRKGVMGVGGDYHWTQGWPRPTAALPPWEVNASWKTAD